MSKNTPDFKYPFVDWTPKKGQPLRHFQDIQYIHGLNVEELNTGKLKIPTHETFALELSIKVLIIYKRTIGFFFCLEIFATFSNFPRFLRMAKVNLVKFSGM